MRSPIALRHRFCSCNLTTGGTVLPKGPVGIVCYRSSLLAAGNLNQTCLIYMKTRRLKLSYAVWLRRERTGYSCSQTKNGLHPGFAWIDLQWLWRTILQGQIFSFPKDLQPKRQFCSCCRHELFPFHRISKEWEKLGLTILRAFFAIDSIIIHPEPILTLRIPITIPTSQ